MYKAIGYLLILEGLAIIVVTLGSFLLLAYGLVQLWVGMRLLGHARWAHSVAIGCGWLLALFGSLSVLALVVGAFVDPNYHLHGLDLLQGCLVNGTIAWLGALKVWGLSRPATRELFHRPRTRWNCGALLRAACVTGFAVWLAPKVVASYCDWSKIDCRIQSVDIQSGQRKDEYYFWFLQLEESVRPTYLSNAVGRTPQKPGWQVANRFGPYRRNSPHYYYHSALYQIRLFENVMLICRFSPQEVRGYGEQVLELWQTHGGDDEVGSFLYDLVDEHAPDD